jgi:hypothetical protein
VPNRKLATRLPSAPNRPAASAPRCRPAGPGIARGGLRGGLAGPPGGSTPWDVKVECMLESDSPLRRSVRCRSGGSTFCYGPSSGARHPNSRAVRGPDRVGFDLKFPFILLCRRATMFVPGTTSCEERIYRTYHAHPNSWLYPGSFRPAHLRAPASRVPVPTVQIFLASSIPPNVRHPLRRWRTSYQKYTRAR